MNHNRLLTLLHPKVTRILLAPVFPVTTGLTIKDTAGKWTGGTATIVSGIYHQIPIEKRIGGIS